MTAASTAALDVAAPLPAGDGFVSYAVTTRSGPHVTVQAGVVQGSRFITTTSRDSLKARSVRSHRMASATVEHGDGSTELLAGATVAVDLRHPEGIFLDPAGALVTGPAALRLAGDQIEQLLGYVESAGAVPSGWLPHNRVLLVTRIDRSLVLDGYDVLDGSGDWAPHLPPAVELACTPDRTPGPLPPVPAHVQGLVRDDVHARLGVGTPDGPVAVPARWRGDDRVDVSAAALAHLSAQLPGPACLTFDDSTSRRPDEKLGVMLRGRADLVGIDGARATVALRTERITSWDGFSADTADVPEQP